MCSTNPVEPKSESDEVSAGSQQVGQDSVQPRRVSHNWYQLFSLPATFILDEDALKKRYFELQREFHPDKAGLAGAARSAELNQAYQTLKDPINRAQHFLALYGVDVGHDHSAVKPSIELLEEMMEKREAVMELETKQQAQALLDKSQYEFEEELEKFTQITTTIIPPVYGQTNYHPPVYGGAGGEALDKKAASPLNPPARGGEDTKKSKQNAAQSLLRLQYITKWQGEIKLQLKKLS